MGTEVLWGSFEKANLLIKGYFNSFMQILGRNHPIFLKFLQKCWFFKSPLKISCFPFKNPWDYPRDPDQPCNPFISYQPSAEDEIEGVRDPNLGVGQEALKKIWQVNH